MENIDIDNAFGQLLSAIEQFYTKRDKEDFLRNASIARQSVVPSLFDKERALKLLKELDFADNPECQGAKDKVIKMISSD